MKISGQNQSLEKKDFQGIENHIPSSDQCKKKKNWTRHVSSLVTLPSSTIAIYENKNSLLMLMKISGQNQPEKRISKWIENHISSNRYLASNTEKKKNFHTVGIQSRNYPTNSLNG